MCNEISNIDIEIKSPTAIRCDNIIILYDSLYVITHYISYSHDTQVQWMIQDKNY